MVGVTLAAGFSLALGSLAVQSNALTFILVALLALPISSAQWVVLRRLQPGIWMWMITIPGALLLWSSFLKFRPDSISTTADGESIPVIASLYAIFGLFIGIFQWLILRRRYDLAWIWIAGNGLSIGMGAALFMGLGASLTAAIVWILIYIGGTGVCLLSLLNHPSIAESRTGKA